MKNARMPRGTGEVTSLEAVIDNYIRRALAEDASLLPLENATSLPEKGVLDSLSVLQLMVFVQERSGVLVDDEDLILENFGSVEAIRPRLRSMERGKADRAGSRG